MRRAAAPPFPAAPSRFAGAPERGDLLERHAFLGQHRRDRAFLAQRHQGEPEPVVRLVALRDQAAPVREHGAEAAEAGVHGGTADRQVRRRLPPAAPPAAVPGRHRTRNRGGGRPQAFAPVDQPPAGPTHCPPPGRAL